MLGPSDSPSLVSVSEVEPLVTPFPSCLLPSQSPIRKTVCLKVNFIQRVCTNIWVS